jgi:hypothetical protein
VFHSLNLTNNWNIPQGHQADAFGLTCYSCSSPEHTSDICPLPHNEANITKAKEVRAKSVPEGRGSGGHGCGHGRGDGRGGCGGDCNDTRGKWGANKGDPATPDTNTFSNNCVEKQNGKWMMNCKSWCGWNETHTSGFHWEWNQNQSTFCIPVTHLFLSKTGTTPSAEKGPAPAASTTSTSVPRGHLSGLINRYKTESDDGAFASFQSELEGLLN